MRPIHPNRPMRTLTQAEMDEKTRAFAEKHGIEYTPGDSFGDVFARMSKRNVTRLTNESGSNE
jgi:hypothetical protein